MKLVSAAATAAMTALLCLGTPAEAKCGDSGSCNHGRIYAKPVKAKTANSQAPRVKYAAKAKRTKTAQMHRTTKTKTAQVHRTTKTKSVKTAKIHRINKSKSVKTTRIQRVKKAAPVKLARFRTVTTMNVALSVPARAMGSTHTSPSNRHGGSSADVVGMITSMSPQHGVPTWFALRIAKIESGYNPRLRGKAGEYGVFQIKCNTARGLGFNGDCSQLSDARTNVRWGLEHLAAALKSSGGNLQLAASKHNGGLGRKTIIRRYVNLVF